MTDDDLQLLLDKKLTDMTTDELMAVKQALADRGVSLRNSLPPEAWAAMVAAGIYGKAFLETLGQRHANAVADRLNGHEHQDDEVDGHTDGDQGDG
jgi:hypothetical protein